MSGKIPDKIWLFRIVHWQNVEYILEHGMYRRGHERFAPNYVNIGDASLILNREDHPVRAAQGGVLGDYVPFYFWGHMPMLLNIITGFRVDQRPQRDIVYICCSLDRIERAGCEYVFTNGHAKDRLTTFFREREDLFEVDWDAIKLKRWNNTDEDRDRMRRKQAEFLVKEHVPVDCIENIVVLDDERAEFVKKSVERLGLNIAVHIDKKHQFYYP